MAGSLIVSGSNQSNGDLLLTVAAPTPGMRAHIFGQRVVETPTPLPQSCADRAQCVAFTGMANELLASHLISEEERYIMLRARQPHRPGTRLAKPGVVVFPWLEGSRFLEGRGGGSSETFGSNHGGGRKRALSRYGGGYESASTVLPSPVLNLLPGCAPVWLAVPVPADGRVLIPAQKFPGCGSVDVWVCAADAAVLLTGALPPAPLPVRDPRAPAMMQTMIVERDLVSASSVRFASSTAASVHIASVADVLRLSAALGTNEESTWLVLGCWDQLETHEKVAFYRDHACHELHLFLRRHDPDFFIRVVRPAVANKVQLTLIDAFILDRDCWPWLAGERWARLNAVERAVLAQWLRGHGRRAEAEAEYARLVDDAARQPSDHATRDAWLRRAMGLRMAQGDQRHVQGNQGYVENDQRSDSGKVSPPARAERKDNSQLPEETQPLQLIQEVNEIEATPLAPHQSQVTLYSPAVETDVWIERDWWQIHPSESTADVVKPNRFWSAVAAASATAAAGDGIPSIDDGIIEALAAGPTAARAALAFIAVPLRATATSGFVVRERLTAARLHSNAISTNSTTTDVAALTMAMRVHALEPSSERDADPKTATAATTVFTTRTPYQLRAVISNRSGSPDVVAITLALPSGAVPLGAVRTHTQTVIGTIPADGQITVTQDFCWLEAQFSAQPAAVVTQSGAVLAHSAVISYPVIVAPVRRAWYEGDPASVVARVGLLPTDQWDETRILGLCHDPATWRALMQVCAQRRFAAPQVWGYGLVHGDPVVAGQWLRSQPSLIADIGSAIDAGWVQIDPLNADPSDPGRWTLRDVAPLILSRAHRLSERPTIDHAILSNRHTALCEWLALLPRLSADQRLALVVHLTTLERNAEATAQWQRIDRRRLTAQMQGDYVAAWLAVVNGDLPAARAIAAKAVERAAPGWRERFSAIIDLVAAVDAARRCSLTTQRDAVEELHTDPATAAQTPATMEQRVDDAAQAQPLLRAAVFGTDLELTHAHCDAAQISIHPITIESLFSADPFAVAAPGAGVARAAWTAPSATIAVTLRGQTSPLRVTGLPATQAAVVVVTGGGTRITLTRLVSKLTVKTVPTLGRLQVCDRNGMARPAAYVKAYALNAGSVKFHRDGYTDALGWIDYASLSGDDLNRISSFAVLVVDDQLGAEVMVVPPPSR